MQTEEPAARTARQGATRDGGRRSSGPRARTNACLLSLGGTAATGLLALGQLPHGDAWAAVPYSGGPTVLSVLHVTFGFGLTVSTLWHLYDRRRSLVTLAKRRGTRSLRSQLVYVALVGLLLASLVTGFVGDGRSQVAHHVAVSSFLLVAFTWHGVRRIARRCRTPRNAPMGVRP